MVKFSDITVIPNAIQLLGLIMTVSLYIRIISSPGYFNLII